MSQHDMDLANAAGASFRADLNLALAALVGNSSGATAPATTFAYQLWADTTSGWIKQRDAANAAWIKRWPLGTAARTDIASAGTLDLDGNSATSDYMRVTGTTTTTAITLADGQKRFLIANAAWPITHGASLICPGSASYTCAAGDLVLAIGEPTGVVRLMIWKADGTPVVGSSSSAQIQPISASVGANALTISASALSLAFRSATLTSGTITTVSGTPSNLVISSGSTLGTVANVASRLAVIAMNNAGTIELAVRNVTAGANLDETGLISTTAEGGAGAADSATVNYSTTARTNLAYRVIGYIESTQATPGTWVTSPSTIQGEGGNAHAVASAAVIGTAVASASQTFIDFIGIPAWATEINISMTGGSLNATDYWRLQAGDAGGIENTGYVGAAVQVDTGSSVVFGGGGFDSISTAAANTRTGLFTLKLIDRATNTWICHALMVRTETAGDMYLTFGHKALTDTLTQVRLTTGTGTSTMDAGSFNFSYK